MSMGDRKAALSLSSGNGSVSRPQKNKKCFEAMRACGLTSEDLTTIFPIVEEMLPVCEADWIIVYQQWRLEISEGAARSTEGLGGLSHFPALHSASTAEVLARSKQLETAIQSLWNQRVIAGDPNVPWEVRKAKQLQRKIEDKQDAILAVEEENRIRELYEQREAVARSSFGSIEVDQSCHAAEDSGYSYSGSDEAEEDSNSHWTPLSTRSASGNIVIACASVENRNAGRDTFAELELGRSAELCFFDSYAEESGYAERVGERNRGRPQKDKEGPKKSRDRRKRPSISASNIPNTGLSTNAVSTSLAGASRRRTRGLAPEHLKHEKYIEGNSVTRWHSIEEDDMVLKKSMSYLSNEAMEIERQIASKEIVELISLDSKGLKSLDYYLSTLASKQKIHLINISRNSLTCFPECIQLDNICRINLSRNFLKSANIACDMPSLIELDLSNNDLREFLTADTLRRISNVATLCLHSNKIDHLPGDLVTILAGFGKLTDLNLSYNHIQLLPDEIGQLTCLSSLRLGGNLLSRLPLSITSLNASVKLDISDNKLVYPPQDVAKLGMRYIRGYFEEKENKVKFSQFKLIVVGHESAGKTSTVNCLVDSMQASSIFSGLSAVGETEPRARLSPVVASSEQLLTADVSLFDDVEQPVYSPPRKGACGAAPESTIGLDIKKVSFRLPSMPRDSPNHGMSSPSKISASHSSDYISTGFDPGASNNAAAREGDDLVTLSVWDFAGQEIYHSAHEAFFSNQALYLVVWDMRNHSPRSIDLKVQFWIDLIQVRAPGSSIIVVGTRKDALPPSKVGDILHQLSTQLQRNESNRIDRVAQDIAKLEEELLTHRNKTDSSEVMSKLDNLKSALNLRPKIRHCVSVCTRLSSSEPEAACSPESYDISELVDAIVSVSTISKDVQNPFQLVNVLHPMYYESVRKVISELKNVDYMMDLDDLHRIIQSRAAKGGASSKQSTEAAVAFLASIGEVIWFRDSSLLTTKIDFPRTPSSTSIGIGVEFDEILGDSDSDSISATWKDTGDIGGYVVLSPHWLLNAMKCVLTHKLSREVNLERSSHFEISKYFGSVHNQKNGIASWLFVEQLLKLNSVKLPREYSKRLEHSYVLRRIFIMFNIIIPIEVIAETPRGNEGISTNLHTSGLLDDSSNEGIPSEAVRLPAGLNMRSHKSSECVNLADVAQGSTSTLSPLSISSILRKAKSVDDGMSAFDAASPEEFFLIPALLSETKKPSLPRFAAASAGSVRMERRYYFDIFVPPNIIPRVLARAFEFLDRKPISGGLGTSNQCWRTAFSQKHGPIQIWLWLEDGASSMLSGHDKRGAVGVLRLVGFGSFFRAQEIIQLLDKYSAAAACVLNNFPGLCNTVQTMICPMCLMSQIEDADCGEFLYPDVVDEFDGASNLPLGPSFGNVSVESLRLNKSFNEHRGMLCQQRMCSIPFELLVDTSRMSHDLRDRDLPRARKDVASSGNEDLIVAQQQIIKKMERSLNYLMSEVIRLSAVPSQSLEKSFASVALCAISVADMQNIRVNGSCSIQIHISSMASGCFAWISTNGGHGKSLAVISCAHFCVDKTTHVIKSKSVNADFKLVYLVGNADKWLYLAEMTAVGTAMKKPQSGHYVEPHSYFCRSCMVENAKYQTTCSNCGQLRPSRAMWDISALSLTHAIHPIDRLNPYVSFCVEVLGPAFSSTDQPPLQSINSEGLEDDSWSHQSHSPLLYHSEFVTPCTAFLGMPSLEQSVRLFGLSGLHSLSIDWGRVVQIVGGLILVNVYSDSGASGGPLFDVQGRLLGVLSVSHANAMVSKAFIEPVGDFLKVLEKHEFRGGLHDPKKCRLCISMGELSSQFVFE